LIEVISCFQEIGCLGLDSLDSNDIAFDQCMCLFGKQS